ILPQGRRRMFGEQRRSQERRAQESAHVEPEVHNQSFDLLHLGEVVNGVREVVLRISSPSPHVDVANVGAGNDSSTHKIIAEERWFRHSGYIHLFRAETKEEDARHQACWNMDYLTAAVLRDVHRLKQVPVQACGHHECMVKRTWGTSPPNRPKWKLFAEQL